MVKEEKAKQQNNNNNDGTSNKKSKQKREANLYEKTHTINHIQKNDAKLGDTTDDIFDDLGEEEL